jgi:hypothetical protein
MQRKKMRKKWVIQDKGISLSVYNVEYLGMRKVVHLGMRMFLNKI